MATLQELAKLTGGQVIGNSELEISGVSEIQNGVAGTITFLSNPKYKKYAADTGASAIIVADEEVLSGFNGLLVNNPQLAFAKVIKHFYNPPEIEEGIHKTAIVSETANIAADAVKCAALALPIQSLIIYSLSNSELPEELTLFIL